MSTLLLLLMHFLPTKLGKCESPRWDLMRQSDYGVDVHRAEVQWYNKTYLSVEKFEAVKFNRTFRRVLNFSAFLYKELGQNLSMSLQFYKLHGNEYKFFPFTATLIACDEYKRNTFGVQDILKKYTNLKLCPQKPGYIYAIHLQGEHNKLPPLMPIGDYKLSAKFSQNEDEVMSVDAYAEVISKKRLPSW